MPRLDVKLRFRYGFGRSVGIRFGQLPVVYRDPELHALVSHGCGNVAYSDSRISTTTGNPYIALKWTVPKRLAYVKSIQLEMLRLALQGSGVVIEAWLSVRSAFTGSAKWRCALCEW
jgi:hypothetical protein